MPAIAPGAGSLNQAPVLIRCHCQLVERVTLGCAFCSYQRTVSTVHQPAPPSAPGTYCSAHFNCCRRGTAAFLEHYGTTPYQKLWELWLVSVLKWKHPFTALYTDKTFLSSSHRAKTTTIKAHHTQKSKLQRIRQSPPGPVLSLVQPVMWNWAVLASALVSGSPGTHTAPTRVSQR